MASALFAVLTLCAIALRGRDLHMKPIQLLVAVTIVAVCLSAEGSSLVAYIWYFFAAVVLMLVTNNESERQWSWTAIAFALTGVAFLLLVEGRNQPLWISRITAPEVGAFAIVALAASGGVLKRGVPQGMAFALALIAAIYDVRLVPLFAIVAAPMAVLAAL